MDKLGILERLAEAERHVMQADRIVRNQQQLLRQLERDGHDTSTAKTLLAEFEHSLALYREDRARIRAELDATRR